MKCQSLFPGQNKKNISEFLLLKLLPHVLRVKVLATTAADDILKYRAQLFKASCAYRAH